MKHAAVVLIMVWYFVGEWGNRPLVLGPFDTKQECDQRAKLFVERGARAMGFAAWSSIVIDCWETTWKGAPHAGVR